MFSHPMAMYSPLTKLLAKIPESARTQYTLGIMAIQNRRRIFHSQSGHCQHIYYGARLLFPDAKIGLQYARFKFSERVKKLIVHSCQKVYASKTSRQASARANGSPPSARMR